MSTENVYLLWDCDQCGHEGIPCSPDQRSCSECGHVRTFAEFDQAYLPGDNDSWDSHDHVVIPADVWSRLQKAGASWFCVVCYADNYGDESECHNCGSARGATDKDLRDDTSYESFVAYMDGDQGASADLVEQFGEYAGMRAAHGESFDMDDDHEGQLERANEGRSAFQDEMDEPHEARPEWDDADLPSSVESYQITHGHEFYEEPDPPKVERPRRKPRVKTPFKLSRNWLAVPFGILFVMIFGFFYWGCQTKEVRGEVTAMNWERKVRVERWENVVKDDWEFNLHERREIQPVNGSGERAGVKILGCAPRHHHYEQYQCGTKEVSCTHMESYSVSQSCTKYRQEAYSCTKSRTESYTCGTYQCNCSTIRNSNGSASRSCSTCTRTCTRSVSQPSTCYRRVSYQDTCTVTKQRPIHTSDTVPKYCDRSIKKQHCEYRTQAWVYTKDKKLSGRKRPAKWPKVGTGRLERSRRSASYSIDLKYEDGGKIKSISDDLTLSEFQSWKVGDPVIVTVTNFGTLSGFRQDTSSPK